MARILTQFAALLAAAVAATSTLAAAGDEAPRATASTSQSPSLPEGAIDGRRFAAEGSAIWRGAAGADRWHWQCEWPSPRQVGAILQIAGDGPLRLDNAPARYVWQTSLDGETWNDLAETRTRDERRAFRLHRLKSAVQARYLRIMITAASGAFPTLREVEVYSDPDAAVDFPEWIVTVSTLDRREWQKRHPAGQEFVALARRSQGFGEIEAQHVWLGDFDETFVSAEPRPLAAFLSGNFSDWCQKDRAAWRGVAQVMTARQLPMWASCGGAQGLAILADRGLDEPWDCPHCRVANNPKTPIYGHIGHRDGARLACGKYDSCTFERGAHNVLTLVDDPVLAGLPREFRVMESHCGQIEYAPRGWTQLATKGAGSLTDMQLLRAGERSVYAAQFHIEMDGTPESSRQIMNNFLNLARRANGIRSHGDATAPREK